MMTPDEGYYFGLGAFETIAVEEGEPVFLEEHYTRLEHALEFFDLHIDFGEIRENVQEVLKKPEIQTGRKALKITVSKERTDW